MRILGIETSCDETAAAVVEDGTKILSNVVSSSEELQKKYGGVLPEQAAREQVKYILPVIEESLTRIQNSEFRIQNDKKNIFNEIDAIAVTVGPGLIGSLLVGAETAKTFAYVFNKPIIPVNHLFGHIYANWLSLDQTIENNSPSVHYDNIYYHSEPPQFPAICLIVSGGHTLLALMRNHDDFTLLGETRDDAAGEAFDKIARLLGLPYPGGPAIQKAAEKGNPKAFTFPRPMINSNDYDFSFSGLKTAVFREVKKLNSQPTTHNLQLTSDLAASVQEAIVDVLVKKTIKATTKYKVKSIIIGGGVAANKRLKEKLLTANCQEPIFIPPPSLCTDNGTVIASAAYFNNFAKPWKDITVDSSLRFD